MDRSFGCPVHTSRWHITPAIGEGKKEKRVPSSESETMQALFGRRPESDNLGTVQHSSAKGGCYTARSGISLPTCFAVEHPADCPSILTGLVHTQARRSAWAAPARISVHRTATPPGLTTLTEAKQWKESASPGWAGGQGAVISAAERPGASRALAQQSLS
ncbi:hypothetical protein BD289DRAFT_497333 [Coniella lustricola]|uniref:Uncharacterized protein n=1 Tax=Coniella lustricola TaxID=2025994 RepID=A0A2T3AC44_9PEZI|nr:hypothetical protein BD289DRAFT_497333 [Coniella lustricola]